MLAKLACAWSLLRMTNGRCITLCFNDMRRDLREFLPPNSRGSSAMNVCIYVYIYIYIYIHNIFTTAEPLAVINRELCSLSDVLTCDDEHV